MGRKWFYQVALGAMLFGMAPQAGADVIFTNLGPGDSFADIGFGFGDLQFDNNRGARFTVGAADYLFTSADAAIGLIGGPDSVTFGIRSDSGNLPGALLQSFSASGLPPVGGGIVTFTAVAPLLLTAGTTFWLTTEEYSFSNGGSYVWRQNNIGINTDNAVRIGNGDWSATAQGTPAFRINGDVVATAPEPTSMSLLGIGLLGAAAVRLRRRATRAD